MQLRDLRRRCEERLRALDLPTPVDVDALFVDLAAKRGRTIEVVLVDTPISGPCALWVSMHDTDYVLVERGTDPLHRAHMKLHEWAHIVCDHRGTTAVMDSWTRNLLPDLDPTMVRRVLGRRTYTADDEAEAEMTASLVLTATAGAAGPALRQPFDGEGGHDLDLLANTLEGRVSGR